MPVEPIPFVEIARDWQGETIAILACGPSLADQDVSLLAGLKTIALNDAWRKLPGADILLLCDRHWTKANPDLSGYTGPEIIVLRPDQVEVTDPRMVALHRGPHEGLSTNRGELAGQATAVTHALSLAALKGATRVLLLGVDLRSGSNGARHFHNDDQDTANAIVRYRTMADYLRKQKASLAALGIEVVNCSPVSLLDCFPRMALAEAVLMRRRGLSFVPDEV